MHSLSCYNTYVRYICVNITLHINTGNININGVLQSVVAHWRYNNIVDAHTAKLGFVQHFQVAPKNAFAVDLQN